MLGRSVLRAALRCGFAVSVALSSMTFGADDADAKRIKVRSSKDHTTAQDSAATSRKSHDDTDESSAESSSGAHSSGTHVPGVRVRSREAARSDPATTLDVGHSPARRHSTAKRATVARQQDFDVPGCPTGMICTVCLAGCIAESDRIVDAQPKTPRPRYRD